jgi:predicted Fe-S protein YdhL (DUF1289 family)
MIDQVSDVVSSPCVNICEVNDANICTGCYRSLDEISTWSSLSNSEQKIIVLQANKRRDKVSSSHE